MYGNILRKSEQVNAILEYIPVKINDKTIDNLSEISSDFNFFVSVASKIKEPIAPSNFDRLRTFCNEKLFENTSFSIPTLSHEKVETYLKLLTSPRLQGRQYWATTTEISSTLHNII